MDNISGKQKHGAVNDELDFLCSFTDTQVDDLGCQGNYEHSKVTKVWQKEQFKRSYQHSSKQGNKNKWNDFVENEINSDIGNSGDAPEESNWNDSPQMRSEWSRNRLYESSSQESDDSAKGGNLVTEHSKFPDLRPYVSFDDLETCPLDVDVCNEVAGIARDHTALASLCNNGIASKWNVFTGKVVKGMYNNRRTGHLPEACKSAENWCNHGNSADQADEQQRDLEINGVQMRHSDKENVMVDKARPPRSNYQQTLDSSVNARKENNTASKWDCFVINPSLEEKTMCSLADKNSLMIRNGIKESTGVKLKSVSSNKMESVCEMAKVYGNFQEREQETSEPVDNACAAGIFSVADLGDDDFDL